MSITITTCQRTFCDIQIEEIAIQDGLYNTSYNSDDVKEPFKIVTVDPVK